MELKSSKVSTNANCCWAAGSSRTDDEDDDVAAAVKIAEPVDAAAEVGQVDVTGQAGLQSAGAAEE